MGAPLIFYPPDDLVLGKGGKYHRATIANTALCGAPVILDRTEADAIHVYVGNEHRPPHPICCRRCIRSAS